MVTRKRLHRAYHRARAGRGWRARHATTSLIRALRSTPHRDDTQPDPAAMLLDVMLWARDERARATARTAVDTAWADAEAARDRIWRAAWRLLGHAHLGWSTHQDDDKVGALLRFLLEPDPSSRYVPQVRLLACLPPEPDRENPRAWQGEPELAPLVEIAVRGKDVPIRETLFDLLCTTDHPRLLTELAHALQRSPGGISVHTTDDDVLVVADYGLWDDNGEPRPLLRILLTNPHLAVPPEVPDMALVLILRDRFDLLRECDQKALVRTLLAVLAAVHEPRVEAPPSHVVDGCRRALRELAPGTGRDLVCWKAIAADAEAVAAARDAGYLPSDERLHPAFLFLTEQWDAYDHLDPDGGALTAGLLLLPHSQIKRAVTRLLDVRGVPATVAGKAHSALRRLPSPADSEGWEDVGYPDDLDKELRVLADLDDGPKDYLDNHLSGLADPGTIARDTVCNHAMRGHAEAKAAAIDAGYLPSDEELHPAFLFLTEQWDAYDHLDPDGARLRELLAESWRHGLPLSAFQAVAKRAGRRVPKPPRPHTTSHRRGTRTAGGHHTDYSSGDAGGGYDSGGHSGLSGGFGGF